MRDSIWRRTLGEADLATLNTSDETPRAADVVIVGAGLIGLSTAYYLVEAGVENVCVVDRGDLIGEASGANAGGLWFAHQCLAVRDAAALLGQSARLYDQLEDEFSFDRTYGGALELIETESELGPARQRVRDIRQAGFEAELLDGAELRNLEPALRPDFAGGLLLPDDGQLHPAMLAAGWIRGIREAGGRVCSGVEAFQLGPPVKTAAGVIEAQCVVAASGSWTAQLTETLGWKPPIRPVRGTLLSLPEMPLGTIKTSILGPNYYWWQLAAGPIAGGGSEEYVGFDQTLDEQIVQDIRDDLARHFPSLADKPTVCAWFGFRPQAEDFLPIIGKVPGRANIFVAAGHFRMGVMSAPATGLALAELITEGETEIDLTGVSPARFELSRA